MSTLEDIRQDGKREDAEDKREREAPEPCGCQWLSECCGAAPHAASPDVDTGTQAGICGHCQDHTAFEKSKENTLKLIYTGVYGDDADGNRGVPLKAWECRECGQEVEVTG